MKNVKFALDGTILNITIDLSKEFGLSATGKSIIIATTEGNIALSEQDDIKLGLNVYKPA